ncbi:hypothetical protein GDO78_006933 [Eleutherodactylus coqui]|uniref:Uncharacterized protein n=1 Tax=Eleutherodactylus coqui TaxID=57060 RepID=A0A8J6KF90_ELECQ|nr:hypothetical protein GDO78_006933 [Eleutherodactylus coqui]
MNVYISSLTNAFNIIYKRTLHKFQTKTVAQFCARIKRFLNARVNRKTLTVGEVNQVTNRLIKKKEKKKEGRRYRIYICSDR